MKCERSVVRETFSRLFSGTLQVHLVTLSFDQLCRNWLAASFADNESQNVNGRVDGKKMEGLIASSVVKSHD